MYKALIWKEYRETRLSLALTVLSCAILSLIIYATNKQNSITLFLDFNVLEPPLYFITVVLISFSQSVSYPAQYEVF